jgi:xanthine dehydrogenase accessory factor
MLRTVVIIRGGGDIGTGVAYRLCRSGFNVVITEIKNPLVIRRTVAFAQAVYEGHTTVEGITAIKARGTKEIGTILGEGHVPVVIDPECTIARAVNAEVVVDATLAKRSTGMSRDMAPLTIGLGPGYEAGKDVHAVIETNRGHNLGRVILEGCAEPNTGIPEAVLGYGEERVLRAPCDGTVRNVLAIGDQVRKGATVCYVLDEEVKAALSGVVRGLILNGITVNKGFKIGDIDPRGRKEYCYTISDKARAIGGGVLEAILSMRHLHKLPNPQPDTNTNDQS